MKQRVNIISNVISNILISLILIMIVCFNKLLKNYTYTIIVSIILLAITMCINFNKLKVLNIQKMDKEHTIILYARNNFSHLLMQVKNDFYLREKINFLYNKDYEVIYKETNKDVDILCAANNECLKDNDIKMIYIFSDNFKVTYSHKTDKFTNITNKN